MITAGGEKLQAKMIIGADGVKSVTARGSGLNPGWGSCQKAIIMTGERSHDKATITKSNVMYIFYGFGGSTGYGYIFPKSTSIDLGIGYLHSFYKDRMNSGLRNEYNGFVDYLAGNGFIGVNAGTTNIRAAVLPVGGPLRKTFSERLILCGDAAGFVNAFTAEGIYYAMSSGEIAARVALSALNHNNFSETFLSRYQDEWESEIGEELEKSVNIRSNLFKNVKLINFIANAANRNENIRKLLTDYAIGQLEPQALNKRLLIRFFPFFIKYRIFKLIH